VQCEWRWRLANRIQTSASIFPYHLLPQHLALRLGRLALLRFELHPDGRRTEDHEVLEVSKAVEIWVLRGMVALPLSQCQPG